MIPWWVGITTFHVGLCSGIVLMLLPRHWRWTWGRPMLSQHMAAWNVHRGWWFNRDRIGMVWRAKPEGYYFSLLDEMVHSPWPEYGPLGSKSDAARACWTMARYREQQAA